MKIFDLTNPEASQGYDIATGVPSLEYTPRLFLLRSADGSVFEADFDAPTHIMTSGGVGCNPELVSPEELREFVRTPLPESLPPCFVVPDGLTEAQAIAAWRYRSIAEACILRPDSHECLAAVIQSGYDLFTDPLSGDRNRCLLRATVVDGFFSRVVADVPLLLQLFPAREDRMVIQETAITSPISDRTAASRYIKATGCLPGEDKVSACMLHPSIVHALTRREILRGNYESLAEWINRGGLGMETLWECRALEGAADVARMLDNADGAQTLYDVSVQCGNTKLCLALLSRGDAAVDAGGLSAVIKRLRDLDVIHRSLRGGVEAAGRL
eukprot:jgi/Tetstr1/464164/TSEL_008969.t1